MLISRFPSGSNREEKQLVNYTMLYDAGDECEDVTGGWGTSGTVTKNADSISIGNANTGTGITNYGIYSKNLINITGYSKAIVFHDCTASTHSYKYSGLVSVWDTSGFRTGKSLKGGTDEDQTQGVGNGLFLPLSIDDIATKNVCFNVFTYYSAIVVRNIYMVKNDNWQEWISKAELTGYSTLEDVLADSAALETLMNNNGAVNYMLFNCTGTVMASVIQSETALDAIRDSQYNAKIFANEHWNKFLRMVGEVPESEKVYLYNKGDEFVAFNSFSIRYTNASSLSYGTVEKNNDDITLQNTSNGNVFTGICSDDVLDFTGYSKLCVKFKSDGSLNASTVDFTLGTGSTKATGNSSSTSVGSALGLQSYTKNSTIGSEVVLELDVSQITTNSYVQIYQGCITLVHIYKIWLE